MNYSSESLSNLVLLQQHVLNSIEETLIDLIWDCDLPKDESFYFNIPTEKGIYQLHFVVKVNDLNPGFHLNIEIWLNDYADDDREYVFVHGEVVGDAKKNKEFFKSKIRDTLQKVKKMIKHTTLSGWVNKIKLGGDDES